MARVPTNSLKLAKVWWSERALEEPSRRLDIFYLLIEHQIIVIKMHQIPWIVNYFCAIYLYQIFYHALVGASTVE